MENIKELVSSVVLYEEQNIHEEDISLSGYLQNIALFTNLDYKPESEFVKLMTIHQSKGLEFKYVFICGLSEGIFPNHRAIRDRKRAALEEERRLAYVAITRTETELYLSESEGYNHQADCNKYPSRFIFEIKENLLVVEGELNNELKEQAKSWIKSLDNDMDAVDKTFDVGDYVSHSVFGKGQVVSVIEETKVYMVKFETFEGRAPLMYNQKH